MKTKFVLWKQLSIKEKIKIIGVSILALLVLIVLLIIPFKVG